MRRRKSASGEQVVYRELRPPGHGLVVDWEDLRLEEAVDEDAEEDDEDGRS